jgi:N-methylhydantoinase B
MMGSIAGMPDRDGVDAGGHLWMPDAITPSVEEYEEQNALLYLYRRFLPVGADGAGRHRSGLGFEAALALHHARSGEVFMSNNESFPKAAGPWGGNPGTRAAFRQRTHAAVHDRFRAGVVQQSLDELDGEEETVPFKAGLLPPLANGDVYAWCSPTTAGYGDPLRRDPATVLADVVGGSLDAAAARRVYGVVITDAQLDTAATEAERRRWRRDRLGAEPTRTPGDASVPVGARRVGDVLAVDAEGWWCDCGSHVAPAGRGYRAGSVVREQPIADVAPEFASPHPEVAGRMVLREFLCGGCGTRLDTEIALRGDPVLDDVELAW